MKKESLVIQDNLESSKQSPMVSWLNDYFQNKFHFSPNFNDKQWEPILYFSLIWNLFETNVCTNNANELTITNNVSSNLSKLRTGVYNKHFDFFKDRYLSNGQIDSKVDILFDSRRSPMRTHLETTLLSSQVSLEDIVKSLLFIAYRIRNNFFHGNKNLSDSFNQTHLFQEVNQVLIDYLEDIGAT